MTFPTLGCQRTGVNGVNDRANFALLTPPSLLNQNTGANGIQTDGGHRDDPTAARQEASATWPAPPYLRSLAPLTSTRLDALIPRPQHLHPSQRQLCQPECKNRFQICQPQTMQRLQDGGTAVGKSDARLQGCDDGDPQHSRTQRRFSIPLPSPLSRAHALKQILITSRNFPRKIDSSN